jgi:predicted glycosyltransferase
MRILIDVLTPKQVLLFQRLSSLLESRGNEVVLTTRKYREVNQLLEKNGIKARTVGEHGGGELKNKLLASTKRIQELVHIFEEYPPDLTIAHSSPEMARVSYGLGIPHVLVSDSPHAEAVARLTVPLSETLLTPEVIPKKAWLPYGITSERIVQYNALDPYVWLKDFKPDENVIEELGIDEARPIITLRSAETFAAYLADDSARGRSLILKVIRGLLKMKDDAQVVVIPRYHDQIIELNQAFNENVIVCDNVVDGPSLLHFSDIFVGMGGTMNVEAVILGTPTFSSYPSESFIVEKYLIDGGYIEKEVDPEILVSKISRTLRNLDEIKEASSDRARKLVKGFVDPLEIINREVERIHESII